MSATSHEMGGRDATGQALGFGDEPEARSVTNTLNAAKRGASLPTPSSCRICCWGLKRDFPPLLGGESRPSRCIYYGRRRHCLVAATIAAADRTAPAFVELFGRANRRLLLPHTLP